MSSKGTMHTLPDRATLPVVIEPPAPAAPPPSDNVMLGGIRTLCGELIGTLEAIKDAAVTQQAHNARPKSGVPHGDQLADGVKVNKVFLAVTRAKMVLAEWSSMEVADPYSQRHSL